MGYRGHGLVPKEKGRKEPITPISYKHNQGLGYILEPKLTLLDVPTTPLSNIDKSDEEEFYEVPFEYLDDYFNESHVYTITPSTLLDLLLM